MKTGRLLYLILVLLFSIPTNGSHVVGGDINIQWQSANNYRIKLRAYKDDVNGAVALPTTITVGVYDAVTHAMVTSQILPQTSLGILPLGDPCYTPDPNVVSIEEGVYESTTDLFIPNNPNGYYLQTQINARNSLAINVQTGGQMVWFAMMADPAIGQNSSPDFNNYPNDAYFCVNSPKLIQYPITDADGDSLAYSLVAPMSGWINSNGTFAGSGPYPYYQNLQWNTGFSLSDIIGGTTPMSIDPTTGEITAAPSLAGFFTFAVRVEEFRDTSGTGVKVKIGESRRDIQYNSFNCTGGNAPSFANNSPMMGDTIKIPYNKEYCKDLIFTDVNVTDTVFMEMVSDIFDSGAYIPSITPDMNGDLHYFYNWNGTSWSDSVVIPPNQFDSTVSAYWNIGTVANRFCWTPDCDEIGSFYSFEVNGFSLGCDGQSVDSVHFTIEVVPPPLDLNAPGSKNAPYGSEFCQDISFTDDDVVDLLNLEITSDVFAEGAFYPTLSNDYAYNGSVVTNVPNGAQNTNSVGARFCWTPDCQHIGLTYSVQAILSSLDCPDNVKQDTIEFEISVTPPFDSLGIIPNVITPNGDGINDTYSITGISNPCTDEIRVEIYNRWGRLVFESDDVNFEWNGKHNGGDVPNGTYFVLLNGIFGNEYVTLDQRILTILR